MTKWIKALAAIGIMCLLAGCEDKQYLEVGDDYTVYGDCPKDCTGAKIDFGDGTVETGELVSCGEDVCTYKATHQYSEPYDYRQVRCSCDGGTTWHDKVKVVIYRVELKAVVFTSDHGVLTDYNTDFAGSGGTVYDPRGWRKNPAANNPISHTMGGRLTASITVKVEPSGLSFDLTGDGPDNYVDFSKTGNTSTGADQAVSDSANADLPGTAGTLSKSISWAIVLTDPSTDINEPVGASGAHTIFVLAGTPGDGTPTRKRIDWVCTTAPASSEPGIDTLLHNGVANSTTFDGSGGTDGWALLDGGSGDCDNQARCMEYAHELMGCGEATVRYVHASSPDDSGEGKCLNLETRIVGGVTHYLILDFTVGAGYNWNAYEGCCDTGGGYYAITPKHATTNDYTMLQAISCQQYWVESPTPPGEPGWTVTAVHEEVAKP